MFLFVFSCSYLFFLVLFCSHTLTFLFVCFVFEFLFNFVIFFFQSLFVHFLLLTIAFTFEVVPPRLKADCLCGFAVPVTEVLFMEAWVFWLNTRQFFFLLFIIIVLTS